MKKFLLNTSMALLLLLGDAAFSQQHFSYTGSWGQAGFNLGQDDGQSVVVTYSVPAFSMEEMMINGQKMHSVQLPGVFLFNEAGAPNVPGTGRYLCIPQGAAAWVEILDQRTTIIPNVSLAPAPRIPKENEDGLEYPVNESIYGSNAFYPSQAVKLSAPYQVRGVDVVMLGISPFQYNPVTQELLVYQDIKIRVHFSGGNGHVGDDRLRSRWFDPLLSDMLLNASALKKIEYNQPASPSEEVGFEYLIIVPNDPYFAQWADTIRQFRTRQGIRTGIKTLSDVGGNTTTAIENYLNNAYNSWDIPPVACLLIGDYGTNAANTIVSPIWDNYCASDNIYGDVDGNSMPDIVMARMTAQDEAQLEVMVRKFIDYERNPPTSEDFYNHPITALGWQTTRWFQICSEVIGGFWKNSLGKDPVRVNAVYQGNPSADPWSTATNTTTVINYFGPAGLGYLPATPQDIGGFSGGTAADVTDALNDGGFMLQHRDHGFEDGWGEPDYTSPDIDDLTNTDLSYIMSVNCLTGKFDHSSEVFAEKFHRYTYNGQPAGALGIMAATEVSYSFVNDAFVWGAYDNFWPEFMPAYGSMPAERGILPAFGNAAGKYFLEQSSWPYNTSNKEVTYNLFHHHGDAFLTVYSKVPQYLTVVHDPTIITGINYFSVTADAGALICLSMNGEILGTGIGTGSPVSIMIPGSQIPPDVIDVVVTKQEYYRYENQVTVVPPNGPYVVKNVVAIDDVTGNNDGRMDYGESVLLNIGMKNVGIAAATNVVVGLSTTDPFVTLGTNNAIYGNISPDGVVSVPGGFSFTVADNIPDNHVVTFSLNATDGVNNWPSYFTLAGHAPKISYLSFTVNDSSGNNNNKIDPGETVILAISMKNTGSAKAFNVSGTISTADTLAVINLATALFGDVESQGIAQASFTITADAATPPGHVATFDLLLSANLGITGSGSFQALFGQIPALVIDMDPNHTSGPVLKNTMLGMGLMCDYTTSMPTILDNYKSIFVCLGVYPGVYALSASQGQLLAGYLDNGGRLYMEGGETWYYDPQTDVHDMFFIDAVGDGSGDLGPVNGEAGTFAEGMSFSYTLGNSYVDRIAKASGSSAIEVLRNQNPSYVTGVAYDGGTYKTIGVSHEFGGLGGSSCPSTAANLMYKYMVFFGILEDELKAGFSLPNNTKVCLNTTVTFQDNSLSCPDTWSWEFPGGTPASSTLAAPQVTYAATGYYTVKQIVQKGAVTDTLVKTNYVRVITVPSYAITPSGPLTVCNNVFVSEYATSAVPDATVYQWALSPLNAGSMNYDDTTLQVYWNSGYYGAVSLNVTPKNSCGSGPVSANLDISLLSAPAVNQEDFDNVCTYWSPVLLGGGSPAGGVYSGNGVINGYFDPSLVVAGMNYITYSMTAANGCADSVTQSIYVDPCVGIGEPERDDFSFEVFPNPTAGDIHIVVKGITEASARMIIVNLMGKEIWRQSLVVPGGEIRLMLDSQEWSRGIYFIRLEYAAGSHSRKLIVD